MVQSSGSKSLWSHGSSYSIKRFQYQRFLSVLIWRHILSQGAMRKEHPVASPDRDTRTKSEATASGSSQLAVAKGMPDWAVAMQQGLMAHTTEQIRSMRTDIDEAVATAMHAQDDIKEARKEFQGGIQAVKDELQAMKDESATPALRPLRELETEFQKLKEDIAKTNTRKFNPRSASWGPTGDIEVDEDCVACICGFKPFPEAGIVKECSKVHFIYYI